MVRRVELPAPAVALLAAAFFTAFANGRFWNLLLTHHDAANPKTWVLAASAAALLFAVHLLLIAPFAWRRVLPPFLTILFLANAVAVHYMNTFNVVFDASMMRNVFETDAREAAELITLRLLVTVLLLGVLPAALVWMVRLEREPFRIALRRRAMLAGVIAMLFVAAAGLSYKSFASFFRNHREARFMVPPVSFIASAVGLAAEGLHGADGPRIAVGEDAVLGPKWSTSPRPVLFVLVVGETARAEEFSFNGYRRDTDPTLRADHVINFPHVDACATSTADSLPCMFSPFGSGFSTSKARHYESLLDVVRHAGLRVIWRENNSGCKGVCDGVETDLLTDASVPGLCAGGECFDEVLLTGWDRILADRRRSVLLVLHQKGSHGPAYYRRYPKEFERFTPACQSEDFDDCTPDEIRNAYDNSILYTDHVLGETIRRLAAARDWDTAMLYVSDHGESLGERGLYLHGLPRAIAPDAQTHVPMMLWMSPSFAARFAIDSRALAARASRPYSHDYLFHSLLGMLDLRTRVYDPQLDFTAGSEQRLASDAAPDARPPL
ncbi:MAG TPA: phosphoethanolamine--lipid A transferase [Thermoanaerobaculia bacterium]|nr:phosphoethanolamine--lipid A transferase [Thermoanaerobaculia bacterium]